MKNYTSNGYLIHNGLVLPPNSSLELSDEQFDRLGNKVTAVQELQEKAEERVSDGPTVKKKTKKG